MTLTVSIEDPLWKSLLDVDAGHATWWLVIDVFRIIHSSQFGQGPYCSMCNFLSFPHLLGTSSSPSFHFRTFLLGRLFPLFLRIDSCLFSSLSKSDSSFLSKADLFRALWSLLPLFHGHAYSSCEFGYLLTIDGNTGMHILCRNPFHVWIFCYQSDTFLHIPLGNRHHKHSLWGITFFPVVFH